jgi:hypothetical protein
MQHVLPAPVTRLAQGGSCRAARRLIAATGERRLEELPSRPEAMVDFDDRGTVLR